MSRAPLALLLAACAGEPPLGAYAPADSDAPAAHVFTFAVLADPHVTAEGERTERLRDALAWIEGQAGARAIELVLVAGDVAWDQGYAPLLAAMEETSLPWVPITGDNEVNVGEEAVWDAAFSPHYDDLATSLDGWTRLPRPAHDPDTGRDAWLQCFAFRWRGVTFVGVDIASRVPGLLEGEIGRLHDFPGGSLPFLEQQLASRPEGPARDVVILTHNPLQQTIGGLMPEDQARLDEVLAPHADRVAMALGGHLHVDYEDADNDGRPYGVYLTDAVWDDEVRLRLIEVWSDGRSFSYVQETVTVPR